MRLAQTSKDAPPSGVEVKKAHWLWEPTLQAVRTVANVPHWKCLRGRVQPGCTTKRYATKQGLIACARWLNPPAIKRKIFRGRARTKQDARNRVPHKKRTAQAIKAAQVSVRDRGATRSVCRADTGTGDDRRDTECLDAHEYWSPV
ncbi:hypothetical protein PF002_g33540 [Phytophthora fragariae]|uniref:Uncharacterized protein n=1 Tax=Phytophthora fragariae TaxID=53985 RepID=A0A6A3GAU4_9STRA|nr:hypothetical protein PF011_g32325 [Phytophthora fragariae]KAE9156730.1 hypothetical protein PF002_g33540 [Phytophthora fragariae]